MRKYSFASGDARRSIDMRRYEDLIQNAVHEVIPNAKVVVLHDCYVVDEITKGESIKIGRILASTIMGKNCITISKLFCGEETDETKIERKKEEEVQIL